MMHHHILIIDDDDRLCDLIGRFLADQGYRITKASSAEEARKRLKNVRFDLMVVDIMMPGESGLDMVRSLKSQTDSVPCLMLTAMGEPGQRLHGLESGADDYMTKPFEPQELVLRIRNLLKRSEDAQPPTMNNEAITNETGTNATGVNGIKTGDNDSIIIFGPHYFDPNRQILTTGGKRQHITSAEKDLLSCFCTKPNNVLSRNDISTIMSSQMTGRSIDVAVARLRRKLEPNPSKPIYLLTVRGLGWMLDTDNYQE